MDTRVGRPRIYTEQEEPLRVVSVRLPNWHIRAAKKLGDGVISEGVRTAIEIADLNQKEKK